MIRRSHQAFLILLAACAAANPVLCVQAPKGEAKQPAASSLKPDSSKLEDEVDPVTLTAISVVDMEIDRSKKYNLVSNRVRILAAAADAIWDFNAAKAQRAVRDAFEQVKDARPLKRVGEAEYLYGLRSIEERNRLRTEVLTVIQRHDPSLVKEILKIPEEPTEKLNAIRNDPRFFGSSSLEKRSLARLAVELAPTDPDLAVKYAIDSLGFGVPEEIQDVFLRLMSVDTKHAHDLFARATDVLAVDASLNLQDTAILSFYLRQLNQPDPDTTSARKFLAIAFDRITRVRQQLVADGKKDQGLQSALLLNLTLHIPLARTYWPEIAGEMLALSRQIAPDVQPEDARSIESSFSTEDTGDIESLLTQADAEKNDENRDSLYFHAALLLSRKGQHERSLEIASRARDTEKRQAIMNYLWRLHAHSLISSGKPYEAIKVIERITDPEERASITVDFVADARKRNDLFLAKSVLNELRKKLLANPGSTSHARAYLWLASSYARIDTVEGFELMLSAIQSANKAKELSDFRPEAKLLSLGGVTRHAIPIGDSKADFRPGFRVMARNDFTRTIQIAESFDNELFRGIALITSAGSILEKSSKTLRSK